MSTVTGQQLVVDRDVQAVLEFMQANILTNHLVGVAESLPDLARLLWGHHLQEPFQPLSLTLAKPNGCNPSQLNATV